MATTLLGELLVSADIITQEQLFSALEEQKKTKERLGAILIRKGFIDDDKLVELLSKQHGIPSIDIERYPISSELSLLIPEEIAKKILSIPLQLDNNTLTVALANYSAESIAELKKITGYQIAPVLAKENALKIQIEKIYSNKRFIIPKIKLTDLEIPTTVLRKLSAQYVHRYQAIPVKESEDSITIAIANPLDVETIDELRLLLNKEIHIVSCDIDDLKNAIKKYYGVGAETAERMESYLEQADKLSTEGGRESIDIEDMSKEASVIRFVNQIILEAFKSRASDIHMEAFEEEFVIRYRIDGVLHKISIPPNMYRFHPAIISRVKIMANLDIAEKRLPQDGRIGVRIEGNDLDLRVSTIPTPFGENAVIRILNKTSTILGLEQLGMDIDTMTQFSELIKKPHGIILVTGPTGSGKTTTLYAALNKLNDVSKKIITIEDPIEYQIKGLNQIQVLSEIGLTFAKGLRSILRQDPDIIMIGEIRDLETAEIAIRASLTGHLVLSTLHTNDSASAITRLIDMGIVPYLVASSLEGILAQRLVRVICPHCKEGYIPDDYMLRSLGLKGKDEQYIIYHSTGAKERFMFYRGKGCEQCFYTGYKGQTGIYELITINSEIQELIMKSVSSDEIKEVAKKKFGLVTIREDGLSKVISGITTVDEILRVTQEENE